MFLNLRNIWRFFWRVILTIFDDVDDGVNLHHYLNPFRAPPSTSHTRTPWQQVWPRPPTFGGSICYIRKYLSASFYVQFQLLELPIWDHKTDILPRQDRLLCVCVCVCTIDFHFVYCDRRKLTIWQRERGRKRDTPSPLHTQKRNSVEHIKALGKALQCFSCFQIFVHSSSLFFFSVPFSKFRRIAVVEELCLISATHRIWSVKRTSSQGRVLRASLPKWPPTSCRRNRSGPTSARMIPILRFHLPIIF